MSPTNGPAPGYLDRIMNFLFGQGALNQAAQQGGQNPIANAMQTQSPQQPQSSNQMQSIVNAYMQQKAAADALKKSKGKKKQPVLEEDD
jgi:hypothetical protein